MNLDNAVAKDDSNLYPRVVENNPRSSNFKHLVRTQAKEAGLYAIEESPGKWSCLRLFDSCFLARGERSESLALSTGLARTKFL